MLCSTLYTFWCFPAIIFGVTKLLTTHALGDFTFGVRCFELDYCVEKGSNVVDVFVVKEGLMSTKWMGRGFLIPLCLIFQMFITSCPLSCSSCLIVVKSVDG